MFFLALKAVPKADQTSLGDSPFEVTQLSSEDLQTLTQNIRTAGIKNGSKEGVFDVKIPQKKLKKSSPKPSDSEYNRPPSPPEAQETPSQTQAVTKTNKVSPATAEEIQLIKEKKEKLEQISTLSLSGKDLKNFFKRESLGFSAPREAADFLNGSDVNVRIEIPEGIPLSELNSFELMFYGFQRRAALSYISSFMNALHNFTASYPHIHLPVVAGTERLTGKVTFDHQGNIKKIKMLQSSQSEKTQDLFLKTLEGIERLPNPPKALTSQGDFSIYYSLLIYGS